MSHMDDVDDVDDGISVLPPLVNKLISMMMMLIVEVKNKIKKF